MNKSKIEWTDSSWNPVTGCYHTCEYCYARRMAKRFSGDVGLNVKKADKLYMWHGKPIYRLTEPFVSANEEKSLAYPCGFAPTFHEYRLDWPQTVKNGRRIFVGSMSDIFGEWVSDEIIKKIFEACEKAPQHTYIFLTKNPKRYIDLAEKGILPDNPKYWYGTSVTTADTPFFWHNNLNTFASIEPILEPFDDAQLKSIKKLNWIIIGAETGNRKDKVIPKKSWIDNIVKAAKELNIPVFMKDSLIPIMGEENMLRESPASHFDNELSEKKKTKLFDKCFICGIQNKKSDMNAVLIRAKRGEGAKHTGYVCEGCLPKFIERITKWE